MDIVVRLRPEAANALSTGTTESAGMTRLASVLAETDARLTPNFPGNADPTLASYYTLSSVPDEDAERIRTALLELDEVEEAYPQPTPFPA